MNRRGSPYSRPFRPRRWAQLLLLAAVLAVAADLFLPAGPFPPRERHVILVRRGETLRGVAAELQRVGVLRGTLGFQILSRLLHLDRSIKAGQYSFRLGITVPALLHAFARGMSGLSLITIPEGLTTAEISVLLSNRLGVPIAEFDSLAHHRAFLDSLGISAPSIEGYLAPDSYEFLPGTSPELAFRTMAARQHEVLLKAAAGRDSLPLSMSLHDVLTLASIVESEAQEDDERPIIARVYLNRLQRHMRLQADPTVGYGLGIGPRSRLYLRQLKLDTPFNTYLFEGLPPGPICNPGRASVDAVINPAEGVSDLYFVAKGGGRHLFALTYQQHLRNIVTAHRMIAAAAEEPSLGDTVAVHPPTEAPASDSMPPEKPKAIANKETAQTKTTHAKGSTHTTTTHAKGGSHTKAKAPGTKTTPPATKTTSPATKAKPPATKTHATKSQATKAKSTAPDTAATKPPAKKKTHHHTSPPTTTSSSWSPARRPTALC